MRLFIILATAILVLPGAGGAVEQVRVHIFTAEGCPHCIEAKPFFEELKERHPEIDLLEYDVWGDRQNFELMVAVGKAVGCSTVSTPTLVIGEQVWFGFDSDIANEIEAAVVRCSQQTCRDLIGKLTGQPQAPPAQIQPSPTPEQKQPLTLPVVGTIDSGNYSLPALTIVIGLLDSFNPCAFFILLFLLGLLVHVRSRGTMLLIGGVFVLCSGLVYFFFMAAWLNLFLLAGQLKLITVAAGLVALAIAGINIKDYFFFHQGVTLSIPETAKPRLFSRMRRLIRQPRISSILVGTIVLAIAANSYELLCTAGFPMVYTRLLTLHQLTSWQHYGYLVLYNLTYVLPLIIIVLTFTLTLGSRKLSEWHGRVLKLVSGMMMLVLGMVLLVDPNLLNNLLTSALIIAAALALSCVIIAVTRKRYQ